MIVAIKYNIARIDDYRIVIKKNLVLPKYLVCACLHVELHVRINSEE